MSADKTYAFIFGCSRSGTTALTRLANLHPDVCIGPERFSKHASAGTLSPALYEPERFRDFRPEDTHHKTFEPDDWRSATLEKIGTARVVGDKLPQLAGNLDQLEAFGRVKLVCILREPYSVSASFERRASNPSDGWSENRRTKAAVTEFNTAMKTIRDETEHDRFDIMLIEYRTFFTQDKEHARFFEFLGVDPAKCAGTKALKSKAMRLKRSRVDIQDSDLIAMRSDFFSYRALIRASRAQSAAFSEETI